MKTQEKLPPSTESFPFNGRNDMLWNKSPLDFSEIDEGKVKKMFSQSKRSEVRKSASMENLLVE